MKPSSALAAAAALPILVPAGVCSPIDGSSEIKTPRPSPAPAYLSLCPENGIHQVKPSLEPSPAACPADFDEDFYKAKLPLWTRYNATEACKGSEEFCLTEYFRNSDNREKFAEGTAGCSSFDTASRRCLRSRGIDPANIKDTVGDERRIWDSKAWWKGSEYLGEAGVKRFQTQLIRKIREKLNRDEVKEYQKDITCLLEIIGDMETDIKNSKFLEYAMVKLTQAHKPEISDAIKDLVDEWLWKIDRTWIHSNLRTDQYTQVQASPSISSHLTKINILYDSYYIARALPINGSQQCLDDLGALSHGEFVSVLEEAENTVIDKNTFTSENFAAKTDVGKNILLAKIQNAESWSSFFEWKFDTLSHSRVLSKILKL